MATIYVIEAWKNGEYYGDIEGLQFSRRMDAKEAIESLFSDVSDDETIDYKVRALIAAPAQSQLLA